MRLDEVNPELLDRIKFDANGLVPAIIQDASDGTVLMMAYMNKESLAKTLSTGYTWFYSRSRQQLWNKGATSGHYQHVQAVYFDCDADTLLVKVEQEGVACHEGFRSCFHYQITEEDGVKQVEETLTLGGRALAGILDKVLQVILDRKEKRPEGSYTSYLFNEGQDKILKKVGEETAEVVIASKNNNEEEVIYELADLYYHTLVLMAYHGLSLEDLAEELASRR